MSNGGISIVKNTKKVKKSRAKSKGVIHSENKDSKKEKDSEIKPKETMAKNSLKGKLDEVEKLFKDFKSLDSPLVDWQLYALLRRLGLNKYEILAYVALVVNGPQTISQLTGMVSKTGIPQPRAYDIMGSLIRYGLIEESSSTIGKSIKRGSTKAKIFRAIMPDEGLENYMSFFLTAKEHALEKLMFLSKHEDRSYGGVWDISKNSIINTAKRIINEAEHEILIVAGENIVKKLKKPLKEIHQQSAVNISVVLRKESFKAMNGNDQVDKLGWFSYMAVRQRMLFLMPYILVDRKYALMWHKDVFQDKVTVTSTGQLIENIDIVETLIDNFFVTNWNTANILTDELNKDLERNYPISCCHIQTAIDEIEFLKSQNKKVTITVEGINLKTGEKDSLTGEVVKTQKNWEKKIFTIYMNVDGKEISIGGMKSVQEYMGADVIFINQN